MMNLPWRQHQPDDEEQHIAQLRYNLVRGHLRVVLNELELALRRIEDKRRRGMPGD